MYIWWGPELLCFYNDAYRRSIGPERHPGSLGQPARAVWAEIWDVIGPQIDQVMSGGGATWQENALIPITRDGRREDVYWTYSYGPIDDEDAPNGVGGVLVVCTETTDQVLAIQQAAEEARQESEARLPGRHRSRPAAMRQFRLLVKGVADYAIFLLDPNGVRQQLESRRAEDQGLPARRDHRPALLGVLHARGSRRRDAAAGFGGCPPRRAASRPRSWRLRKDGTTFPRPRGHRRHPRRRRPGRRLREDHARHHRARRGPARAGTGARGALSVAETGSHWPGHRRRRARLQQPPDGHPRQPGTGAKATSRTTRKSTG